jgi:signal transduction histidine kinase
MELAFYRRLKRKCSIHSSRPSRSGEGTGLGLSISHDIIVKQHGGSIEVDNKLKRPLPLSPPRAQRAAPKSPKIREGYSGLPLAPFITGKEQQR